jgi:predicted dithiol-disulfide oxidoreductase (DUF899 family)
MSALWYPNESKEYREARDVLLQEEQALIDRVKAVAEKRRTLPLGGKLKEKYVFEWVVDGKVGENVEFFISFSHLYGTLWI